MEHRLESHQFVPRHERIDRGVLQGHANDPPDICGRLLYVVAADPRCTPGGSEQGGEHPDSGRLAGTVGPQKSKDLATGNGQVDSVNSDHLTEGPFETTGLDHDVAAESCPRVPAHTRPFLLAEPRPGARRATGNPAHQTSPRIQGLPIDCSPGGRRVPSTSHRRRP